MWHDLIASQFANALLNPSLAKPAGIVGPNSKAADKRFNVYRNNVAYSLIEALGNNYPAVKANCGAARFNDAAKLYLDEHPPRIKIMFNLGGNFADWLDDFTPAKNQMPWLADLARLERAWLDAYHAEDAIPLDPALLAATDPAQLGNLRFKSHPAAAIVCSTYAIHTLLQAGRSNAPANPAGAQDVLVTRPQFAVEMNVLSNGAASFFKEIIAGNTLSSAAETSFTENPAFDLSSALGGLLQSGATTALY